MMQIVPAPTRQLDELDPADWSGIIYLRIFPGRSKSRSWSGIPWSVRYGMCSLVNCQNLAPRHEGVQGIYLQDLVYTMILLRQVVDKSTKKRTKLSPRVLVLYQDVSKFYDIYTYYLVYKHKKISVFFLQKHVRTSNTNQLPCASPDQSVLPCFAVTCNLQHTSLTSSYTRPSNLPGLT